ncbi:MAG: copper resistance CopC family protein [Alphaproteobacteria bacterium]
MRRIGTIILAVCALLAGAGRAPAHAFLDRADPPVGSTIKESPAEIRLWFSGGIVPALCAIRVLALNGTQVDRGDVRPDNADPAVLQVSVPALAPGVYKVVWRAISQDTHITEGDYTFTVAP